MHDPIFEKVYERPITVQIDMTNGCNLDCIYCYNKYNTITGADLTDKELTKVVDKVIKELNPISVTFSGGESLLRAKLMLKFAKRLKKNDINVFLNTNGLLINEKLAKKLADAKIDLITINIDSLKKQGELRKGTGGVNATINAITTLTKHFPKNKVSIACVVNKLNYLELEEIAAFVMKNKYKGIHLLDMIPCEKSAQGLMLSKQEWKEFYTIYKRIVKTGIKIKPNHALLFLSGMEKKLKTPFCMAGRFKMVITANGKIVPCNYFKDKEFVCGDAQTDNLLKVWQQAPMMKKFRYFEPEEEKCKSCAIVHYCTGGCRALAQKISGDAFAADPYCTVYGLR